DRSEVTRARRHLRVAREASRVAHFGPASRGSDTRQLEVYLAAAGQPGKAREADPNRSGRRNADGDLGLEAAEVVEAQELASAATIEGGEDRIEAGEAAGGHD